MKKSVKYFALCAFACAFVILALSVFLHLEANSKKSEFNRLKSTYISLKSKTNEKNSLTSDEYAEYASLFDAISHGDEEMSSDYAQLVREITDNTVDFEDEEVFTIAKKFAGAYKSLAAGSGSGIQSLEVSKSSSGNVLNVSYIDCWGYSVKLLTVQEGTALDIDALGKYQAVITFFDTKESLPLAEQYPTGQSFTLEGYRFKFENTPDHGLALYIGSDMPLALEEKTEKMTLTVGEISFVLS